MKLVDRNFFRLSPFRESAVDVDQELLASVAASERAVVDAGRRGAARTSGSTSRWRPAHRPQVSGSTRTRSQACTNGCQRWSHTASGDPSRAAAAGCCRCDGGRCRPTDARPSTSCTWRWRRYAPWPTASPATKSRLRPHAGHGILANYDVTAVLLRGPGSHLTMSAHNWRFTETATSRRMPACRTAVTVEVVQTSSSSRTGRSWAAQPYSSPSSWRASSRRWRRWR